jgi:hypothetical protein
MTGRALTSIRNNFAPLGLDVGPPVFDVDECPARPERGLEIAAVTM